MRRSSSSGRLRAHAVEEDADLGLPPLQVGPQDRGLVVVGDLRRRGTPPCASRREALPCLRDAQVADPLRVAPRCDEVAPALEGQQVHRYGSPLAARATAHAQLARTPHAQARAREHGDHRIEDVLREPTRLHVTGRRLVGAHRPTSGVVVGCHARVCASHGDEVRADAEQRRFCLRHPGREQDRLPSGVGLPLPVG